MTKPPIQYVFPGSGSWKEDPVPEKIKKRTSKQRKKEQYTIIPSRDVLLCVLRKSQKMLSVGHSLRRVVVITWPHQGGLDRWVISREITAPAHIHVLQHLQAWKKIGYVDSKRIGGLTCWRLLKTVPEKEETFASVKI